MEFFFLWFFGTIIVTAMGGSRRIGSFGAFIVSLFLSPLIGILVVLASSKNSTLEFQKKMLEAQQQKQEESNFRPMSDLQILEDKYKAGLITKEEYQKILKNIASK